MQGAASMNHEADSLTTLLAPVDAYSAVISEVEKQFAAMVARARRNTKFRACGVHPELQPLGFRTLVLLAKEGPQNQGLLAEHLGSDKTVMSRTIKHLEHLELVSRSVDPRDGRVHVVSLTEDARSRLEANLDKTRRTLHDRLSQWELEEVERFAGLLGKLNESDF